MIQIDSDPADRSGKSVCARPAAHLKLHPRPSTSTSDDGSPSERPSLFVVPPPLPVWPRVFPGL